MRPVRRKTCAKEYASAISRRDAPELCEGSPSKRGSGECRMRAAPAVSCAKLCEEAHTSIQVQRRQSGIPRAMALRLMPRSSATNSSCHRHRRIKGCLSPVGPTRLRQFSTSIGCQDHTALPSASAPFVCASFDRSQAVRPALRSRSPTSEFIARPRGQLFPMEPPYSHGAVS